MKRRWFAALLALCLVVGLLPVGAAAEEEPSLLWRSAGWQDGENGSPGKFAPDTSQELRKDCLEINNLNNIQLLFWNGETYVKPDQNNIRSDNAGIVTLQFASSDETVSPDDNLFVTVRAQGEGETVIRYTVGTDDYSFPVRVVSGGGNDGPGNDYEEPTEDGLYFRDVAWGQSGPTSDENGQKSKALTLQMGSSQPRDFVVLTGGTWGDPLALSDLEYDGPIQLSKNDDAPIDIISTGVGEGHIWKKGNAEDKLTVTVTLPDYGFYISDNPSPETLRTQPINYEDLTADSDGKRYLWMIGKEPINNAQFDLFTVIVIESVEQDPVSIAENVALDNSGKLIITLPDPGETGYALIARNQGEDGNRLNLWISPCSGGSGGGESSKDYNFYAALNSEKTIENGNLAYGDLAADARFVYLRADGGSTEDELSAVTVEITDGNWNRTADATTDLVAYGEGHALKITLPAAGNDGYGVKATIGAHYAQYLWVSPGTGWDILSTGGKELTVGEKSYGVAFGNVMNGDGIIHLDLWNSTYPDETFAEPNTDNGRTQGSNPFTVMAGISIGNGQYNDITTANDAPFTITVDQMWFELYDAQVDSAECFSWEKNSAITTLNSGEIGNTTHRVDDHDFTKPNSAWLYHKEGYAARAIVKAEVTITPKAGQTVVMNGETITEPTKVTVSVKAQVTRTIQSNWTREPGDTVEALNAFLAQQAANIDITQNNHFNLSLADNTTYVGQIVIPTVFAMRGGSGAEQDLRINGGENTVIQGGIDLNGILVGGVSGLTFRAGAENDTEIVADSRAVYGGSLNDLRNCSFENYAVAVDSSAGQIFPKQNNTFIHNGIAVKVDLPASNDNMVGSWYNNIFRNNETAVQVIKLLDPTSPYLFRLCDSDFICNGTDFDIQYPGEYYFYRNYYYCEQQSAVRAPQIQQNDGVTLHCYPARSSSVFDGQGNATEATPDLLILGDDNTILDTEAGNLLIGQDQLSGKELRVVKDEGKGAGSVLQETWSFIVMTLTD